LTVPLAPRELCEIVYWDSDLANHRKLDLDMPAIEDWEMEFEFIGGTPR